MLHHPAPPPRGLQAAAWANAVSHVAASAAMAVVLAPGLPFPGRTAVVRAVYVASNPVGWTVGWMLWAPAALTLLWLCALLALWWHRRHVGWSADRLVGMLTILGLGVLCDLWGQGQLLDADPRWAAGFEAEVWRGGMWTGVVANGLYTLVFLALTAGFWKLMPRALRLLSAAVIVFGGALVPAALFSATLPTIGATALLMPCVIAWSVVVALWARREDLYAPLPPPDPVPLVSQLATGRGGASDTEPDPGD